MYQSIYDKFMSIYFKVYKNDGNNFYKPTRYLISLLELCYLLNNADNFDINWLGRIKANFVHYFLKSKIGIILDYQSYTKK